MKIANKVLAAASCILQLLSLLAFIVVIVFQHAFKGIMGGSPESLDIFTIPATQTFQILLLTLAVLLVAAGAFLKGRGIWMEVLGILLIILISPVVARLGGVLESMLISSKGVEQLVSYSSLQSITALPLTLSGMASSLALVASGMSMAAKKLS